MATERNKLSVNSLDFSSIKSNLKSFLQNQETFSDYDFEGSGLNVLLDILSYFTHYQGVYNNLVANELFLDSAVKRSSVVSHAKALGYTPSSKTSAVATIDLLSLNGMDDVSDGGRGGVLPKNTIFKGSDSSNTYFFVTTTSRNYTQNDQLYGEIKDLELREGTLRNATFIVPSSKFKDQRFRLPDNDIDTDTITVQVFESTTDNTGVEDVYVDGDTLISLKPTSKVFFKQEDFDGVYSISFGDDVLGAKLVAGNVVSVSYVKSSGADANGVGKNDSSIRRTFTLDSQSTATVTSQAAGGSERESIESIRSNAPKAFAAQNRAVTTNDFEALVNSNFSGFRSVYVYGGEDADPPQFGKVLIALNPNIGTVVPSSLKTSIEQYLQERCSVGSIPEVVDPDATYFRYSASVIYNDNLTVLDSATISTLIKSEISKFFRNNTTDFNSFVSITEMERSVLNALPEISTIQILPTLEKRFIPDTTRASDYTIKFKTNIFHPHDGHQSVISTNEFKVLDANNVERTVTVRDNGNGVLQAIENISGIETTVYSNFGSVNYNTGVVSFDIFKITTGSENDIKIRAVVPSTRLSSRENSILLEDTNDTTRSSVSLQIDNRPDRRVTDETLAANTFIGTSSISSSSVAVYNAPATTSSTTTTTTTTSSNPVIPPSNGGGGSGY